MKEMKDKRGKWTKEDLKEIWISYVEDTEYISNLAERADIDLEDFNLNQNSPCPWCGEIMIRAQYQGDQPDKWGSWDVDHIDGNPKNNEINNLQPMHPWCNKEKD